MVIPSPGEPVPIEPEPAPLDPDVPGRPPDPVDLTLAELERGLDRLFPDVDADAGRPNEPWWHVEERSSA